jgi:hypothetical protein
MEDQLAGLRVVRVYILWYASLIRRPIGNTAAYCAAIKWRYFQVQTQSDLKLGTLVVWHGGSYPGNDEDVDDLGIVVNVDRWISDEIQIFWSMTNKTDHFSTEEVDENLGQGNMEIINANSR